MQSFTLIWSAIREIVKTIHHEDSLKQKRERVTKSQMKVRDFPFSTITENFSWQDSISYFFIAMVISRGLETINFYDTCERTQSQSG